MWLAALHGAFGRWAGAESLAAGGHLWWLILLALSSAFLPGFSYMLAWPLLGAALALGVSLQAGGRRRAS